ncbi:hypothetical protein D3C81_1308730 [compost metagenome]
MKRNYRWLNLLALVLVLIVNLLAERLPLGGKTTGQISAQYPVLIAPAGYAFSIWIVIYALLVGFVIYGFTKRARESKVVQEIGVFFILSCLFNVAWLFFWHYEKIIGSVLIMFGLLLTLIVIYIRVNDRRNDPLTALECWLVRLPFSIYLGWICVATIVNVASALYAIEWNGFGLSDTIWTIIMLTVATLIAFWLGLKFTDPAVVLVFIWAFIAISVKQQAYPSIAVTSIVLALLLVAHVLFLVFRKREQPIW